MKEALYYTAKTDYVQCTLCPHFCKIKEGKSGNCHVRKNIGRKLISESYNRICSINSDPIEKKPLYHFYPGKNILSIGSLGCNLHCKFCQNYEISQTSIKQYPYLKSADPSHLVDLALSEDSVGIAYTYNEPTVWYEYMMDVAVLAHKQGLKNVMVTNGYINPKPLDELCKFIDAFSVDLKAFTNDFYKNLTSSSLQPVLDTLLQVNKSGKHLEITNLVIPNQNDDAFTFEKMASWIKKELGPDTVLHISRYYLTHKLDEPATPPETLENFYNIAKSYLHYVYIGNLHTDTGQNTYCPNCNTLTISRTGYFTKIENINQQGICTKCNNVVIPNISS